MLYVWYFKNMVIYSCYIYRSAQQIRNIAEELDPTFQARRQGTMSLQMGQMGIWTELK